MTKSTMLFLLLLLSVTLLVLFGVTVGLSWWTVDRALSRSATAVAGAVGILFVEWLRGVTGRAVVNLLQEYENRYGA